MDQERTAATGLGELARIAGVSISTVSRSLADNPMIALETRKRIMALAAEHGVRVNRAARSLRLKRTEAIGVVLPLGHEVAQHVSDPFFIGLLGPLADGIAERGYDLLLSRVIPRDERWLDALVDAGRVDGMILIGQSDQLEVIERTARRYRPMVVWGADGPDRAQVTVGSNNRLGGQLAARHLIERGRRRLLFLGNPAVPEFAARLEGFRAAVNEVGLPAEMLPVHLTFDRARDELARHLDGREAPDGIVAASDMIAMGALRTLAARGLSVPGDVAVVGYDDISMAEHASPPLTTVRQDVVRGAALLVDILFRRMAGEQAQAVVMTPKLIVREST